LTTTTGTPTPEGDQPDVLEPDLEPEVELAVEPDLAPDVRPDGEPEVGQAESSTESSAQSFTEASTPTGGARSDAAGPPAGEGHHRYYEGGPGASSEPGGEDEFDHGTAQSEGEALAQEDALAASYLSDLQRLQAEYVNYKKRVDRDRDVIRTTAVGSVVESLLPVLDDIHMARQAGDLAGGPLAR